MLRYVIQRLIISIPTLLGVMTIVFFSIRFIPGDPAVLIAGPDATPSMLAEIRHSYGLDQPILIQFVLWLTKFTQADMGTSIITGLPVYQEVLDHFKNTVLLAVASLVISAVMGIGLGTLAGIFRRTLFDRLVMFIVLLGVSMPVFWTGLLLIIGFSVTLRWLPPQGMQSPVGGDLLDVLRHLILPAITLSLPTIAIITRLTRSALLEVARKQYIIAARARGLSEVRIYLKHALANAASPIITVIGAQASTLLGGAILVEVVFNWPGVGQSLINAVSNRDYPMVQGIVLMTATAALLANVAADVLYGVFDPRIRQTL